MTAPHIRLKIMLNVALVTIAGIVLQNAFQQYAGAMVYKSVIIGEVLVGLARMFLFAVIPPHHHYARCRLSLSEAAAARNSRSGGGRRPGPVWRRCSIYPN